jgi:ribosomal protein S18 acetylase RimI-like enzyme
VTIRLATAQEVPLAAAILDEATAFVATKGYEQWPVPYPQEELRGRQRTDELLVYELGGEVAAVFVLQREDVPFWGERPPDALYLHKLAVRRSFAGRGIGPEVVEWALARTREEGRSYLRLDCMRDNPHIRAYYEALGFIERGEVDIGRFVCSLYERAA